MTMKGECVTSVGPWYVQLRAATILDVDHLSIVGKPSIKKHFILCQPLSPPLEPPSDLVMCRDCVILMGLLIQNTLDLTHHMESER